MRIALLTTDSREAFADYSNPQPYFGTAPQGLLDGLHDREDVEVHILSCLHQAPPSSPEKLAPNIWYHGFTVPSVGWMKTGYQGCIQRIRRRLSQIQPDIVHGQGTERDCAISAVFSGFPNVVTIHGNMRVMAKLFRARPLSFYWIAARLESFTLCRTHGVVCITDYTRRHVASLARRTWVVPNAVDPTFFKVERSPISPAVILVVGTVDERKNQNAFITALDQLATEKRFQARFFGKADRASAYGAEYFRNLSERPWCSNHGFIDRAGLREQFAQASLLALPSMEDNCPMTVLEAMAARVPVVAGAVGGIPELIRDRETGWLCTPTDPESIREAVRAALRADGATDPVIAAARQEAKRRFHPRIIAERHLEIYREVIGGSRQRKLAQSC